MVRNLSLKERMACDILRRFGDSACYEEMVQAIERGNAEKITLDEEGVLLRHKKADIWMLAATNEMRLWDLIGMIPRGSHGVMIHGKMDSMMVEQLRGYFRFRNVMIFQLLAYYGNIPQLDPSFDIRPLGMENLDFVYANYGHATKEYCAERLADGVMLGAYVEGNLAAFIGEHVEGAMGMLHVMPEYRRMHLGFALEKARIAKTMNEGGIAFDQVFPDNAASMALQTKLGFTKGEGCCYWFTNDTY